MRNGGYFNRTLLFEGSSTRELIKISGKINGIQEYMTHIVEHLQGIDEKLKIANLAIQRSNNSVTAIATIMTISNYETRLIETAHHISDAMNWYASEVNDFVDGIADALDGRLNEKIIPQKQIKGALKSLRESWNIKNWEWFNRKTANNPKIPQFLQ